MSPIPRRPAPAPPDRKDLVRRNLAAFAAALAAGLGVCAAAVLLTATVLTVLYGTPPPGHRPIHMLFSLMLGAEIGLGIALAAAAATAVMAPRGRLREARPALVLAALLFGAGLFPELAHFPGPRKFYGRELVRAVWKQDTAGVHYFSHMGLGLAGYEDRAGFTPLHHAAFAGGPEAAAELIEAGAEVDRPDPTGKTALQVAAIRRNFEVAKVLARHDASLDHADQDGKTARDYGGDELLAALGAAAPGREDGSPDSLLTAARAGDERMVTQFLEQGADVNLADELGHTALMLAFKGEEVRTGLIKALMDAGADLEATDKYGDTPLHYAAFAGNEEACEMLLQGGASAQALNRKGETPLAKMRQRFAPGQGCLTALAPDERSAPRSTASFNSPFHDDPDTALRQALGFPTYGRNVEQQVWDALRAGANVTHSDGNGDTPLLRAAKNTRFEAIEILVEAGSDVNARNRRGETPLHLAAININMDAIEIFDLLLAHGARVNVRDDNGDTPLHVVVMRSTLIRDARLQAVEILLRHDADPNIRDGEGRTPLHWAAQLGKKEIVKRLLDAGAEVNPKDHWGHTPLHLCENMRIPDYEGIPKMNQETAVVLRSRGALP